MQTSIFSSVGPRVSRSRSQDSERDWTIRVVASCLPILQSLADIGPAGWSGRTCPASCQVTPDETLQRFWDVLQGNESSPLPTDGATAESHQAQPVTASRGECLTLSTLEFPKDAVASSLSDILETGDVPQRYYLSATACRGILRRAEKRGKALPEALRQALKDVTRTTPKMGG